MRYHCLIPLTAALANLFICVLVARQGLRDQLRRTFVAMTLAIVAWNLDIFALYYFTDIVQAEWWSRVLRVGICLAPPVTFHFGLVLSEARGRLWFGLLAAGYAVGSILAVVNLQGLLVTGLTPHHWGWYVQPGPLYGVFSGMLVVFLLLWLERVWHTYRHSPSARRRGQAKFWLLAGLVQVPFALTNLLPIYGINIYPLGNLGNVLFTGIIAHAIVRHRLMDVDYIVRKGLSFGLAATVVLLPGGIGMNALAVAIGADEPVVHTCAALALALVAVVVIPTLQEAVETRLQRALYPHRYDYRRRLRALAAEVVHVLTQGELVKRLGEELTDILEVERCELFVHDEQTRQLVRAYPAPIAAEPVEAPIAHAVEQLRELALASELETMGTAGAALRSQGWEVVIPLRVNERLSGFIGLGPNRNLRIFSAEDLQLLGTLAGSVTVALENARYSRQLRRSEAVLERANRLSSLGTLAAGIAHEIRNPLVAVKTFLDLLPERLDDKEFLDSFRKLSLSEIKRVTNLINDLLSLGKTATAGRRAVALRETIEPVVRLMESTAHKRQVQFVEGFDDQLPLVWADPDQLKQIVLNLLLNAIEVSPENARVRLAARVAGPAGGTVVVLEVGDEGPGIRADQLEDIFLPFFTTKDTGTGLGLALVHQMVVEHGGEITVDSQVGAGTTFRVTLPTARAEQLAANG